jgi:hypothetical protein
MPPFKTLYPQNSNATDISYSAEDIVQLLCIDLRWFPNIRLSISW